jgi:hypothetical protein
VSRDPRNRRDRQPLRRRSRCSIRQALSVVDVPGHDPRLRFALVCGEGRPRREELVDEVMSLPRVCSLAGDSSGAALGAAMGARRWCSGCEETIVGRDLVWSCEETVVGRDLVWSDEFDGPAGSLHTPARGHSSSVTGLPKGPRGGGIANSSGTRTIPRTLHTTVTATSRSRHARPRVATRRHASSPRAKSRFDTVGSRSVCACPLVPGCGLRSGRSVRTSTPSRGPNAARSTSWNTSDVSPTVLLGYRAP